MIKTYTNEGETHRYTKLLCVEMIFNTWYAYAYADDLYSDPTPHEAITSIHDHEGELIITWNQQPSRSMQHTFECIWELLGELRDNVTHKIEQSTNA